MYTPQQKKRYTKNLGKIYQTSNACKTGNIYDNGGCLKNEIKAWSQYFEKLLMPIKWHA